MTEKIIEPTLIIDKKKCLENIKKMADKASKNNLIFRPHFKTHQSKKVGEWFKLFGVDKITVSSVSMAVEFSKHGWKDITIAFPLNPREIERINSICTKTQVNITVENTDAIDLVSDKLSREVKTFIKIDAGYHRTGIDINNFSKIDEVISKISKINKMSFVGFLIHSGQTYKCNNRNEVLDVHSEALVKIKTLRNNYIRKHPDLIVSYGDTPSCSIAGDFPNIDEIRPGNFVYFDLMQVQIGSCTMDEIAATVACPIVAKHPDRLQIIVHGGAVHFSKDSLHENGRKIWGKTTHFNSGKWEIKENEFCLTGLSQEHGTLEVSDMIEFHNYYIGELAFVLPVHSCLTANLLRHQIHIWE